MLPCANADAHVTDAADAHHEFKCSSLSTKRSLWGRHYELLRCTDKTTLHIRLLVTKPQVEMQQSQKQKELGRQQQTNTSKLNDTEMH